MISLEGVEDDWARDGLVPGTEDGPGMNAVVVAELEGSAGAVVIEAWVVEQDLEESEVLG